MKVTVIIVNYNVRYFLEVCLHSVLRAAQGMMVEVIVVDNNSVDDSLSMVRERFPEVIIIENKDNKGFSKANNQGVVIAKGEYILFLNPDTVMPEDFFTKTINYLDKNPKAGALGPRLIDGKGQFAPDAKKSFPTLSVAIFKTTGLNKLFPKSAYINKYYSVHIGEWQTAPVEVLSGCCMLVRKSVIDEVGGAFDENYFMYCEDVDLSYRIVQGGYENIYFPDATLIHYKGESTRKATLSYVRIFNEALITFVRKHYGKQKAGAFILFINIGIVLRAVLATLKNVFKWLRMPLFDAFILLITLWGMKDFWVGHIKNAAPVPANFILATFPAYLLIWIVSLYLNGAYDQPYRALRVVRGMLVGSVIILAYYGLLEPALRYSRALIMISGTVGTVALLGLHELFYRLGIFKFIPYDELPRKAIIVADPQAYMDTAATLQQVHYAPDLAGRIGTKANDKDALGTMQNMQQLLYAASINEVIFCINGLRYEQVLKEMQDCGPAYDYKIHLPGSLSFIGSNSSHSSGDLYTADRRYNLSSFAQQRNKRMIDFITASLFLGLMPVLIFAVRKRGTFFRNTLQVLFGQKTWIGYTKDDATTHLPKIKAAVAPSYNMLDGFSLENIVAAQLAEEYAQHYHPGVDLGFIWRNFKWLGNS